MPMETLPTTDAEAVEMFIEKLEYFAVFRPSGILARLAANHRELGAEIQVKRHEEGVVLRIPAVAAAPLMTLSPLHACDDRLRLLVAQWVCRHNTITP
jgi:hypothetical protein